MFNYLASRQNVYQREFETLAVRNQILLQVTLAYSELLRAKAGARCKPRLAMKRD